MSFIVVKHFELPRVERCYINNLALPVCPSETHIFGGIFSIVLLYFYCPFVILYLVYLYLFYLYFMFFLVFLLFHFNCIYLLTLSSIFDVCKTH